MNLKIFFVVSVFSACLILLSTPTFAGVGNGNDLAREFTDAKTKKDKEEIKKVALGKLFYFRYLRISKKEKGEEKGQPFIKMSTIEPSSDMYVDFVVRKKLSLDKADPIEVDQGIAVTGRLKSVDFETHKIVLDPVIVRHPDRLTPKAGKERLYEIDADARKGTDTSTGEEIIKK